jgi:hypothetical protein
MNKFDAVIRQQFLCMKIPAPKGVIKIFGDQQEARNIEKGHTPGQANVCHVTSWNFSRNVSNAKMWISKFRFEIECMVKI